MGLLAGWLVGLLELLSWLTGWLDDKCVCKLVSWFVSCWVATFLQSLFFAFVFLGPQSLSILSQGVWLMCPVVQCVQKAIGSA